MERDAMQPEEETGLRPGALRLLIENERRFFAFLERRLGSRDAADEVLQAAFLRGIERGASLRADESAIAWFYRLLRNAIAERARRRSVESKALDRFADELASTGTESELEAAICRCVTDALEVLNPGYAAILREVDLGGRSVSDAASALGITPNNAAVRLHRARRALGRAIEEACGACCRSGCFDCDCDPAVLAEAPTEAGT